MSASDRLFLRRAFGLAIIFAAVGISVATSCAVAQTMPTRAVIFFTSEVFLAAWLVRRVVKAGGA